MKLTKKGYFLWYNNDRSYKVSEKKTVNMRVTIIPSVIRARGEVTKRLAQGLEDLEIRGRLEIIQTTAMLRSAKNTEMIPGDLRIF